MGDTEIVEVSLPDGTRLLVRAERIGEAAQGPADVGLRDFLSFSHVTASVRGIAAELHQALQTASPDVVAVDLGFDLAIKGSQVLALVADGGAHAAMSVRLEWHRHPDASFPGELGKLPSGEAYEEPADGLPQESHD